jgi:ferredoxin-type protein NapH
MVTCVVFAVNTKFKSHLLYIINLLHKIFTLIWYKSVINKSLYKGDIMAQALISFIQRFSWILVVLILLFGWSSPTMMVLSLICMIGPIFFSFTFGRAWCGNFCPRASFSGRVLSIISPNKTIPRFLKSSIIRIIAFVLLMSLFIFNLSRPHESLSCLGLTFIKMMAITTILQICFAVLIHPYAWCAFCPMGSVAYCVTKMRKGVSDNIKIENGCTGCTDCRNSCPMQIDIPNYKSIGEVKDADCMKCRKCIEICPGKCLKY